MGEVKRVGLICEGVLSRAGGVCRGCVKGISGAEREWLGCEDMIYCGCGGMLSAAERECPG